MSCLLLPLSRKSVADLFFFSLVNRHAHVPFRHHSLPWAVWVACALGGLLGDVPVRPVGAPEKSELLDEAVKVNREHVVVVSPTSDYSNTPLPTLL